MHEELRRRRAVEQRGRDVALHLAALLIVLVLSAVLVLALDGLLHHIEGARATWGPAW